MTQLSVASYLMGIPPGNSNPEKPKIIHNFIKKLHKRFGEEDIEIPFPVRTLLHKNKL